MAKKAGKTKFLPSDLNDLLNESQFLKDTPGSKKNQKRSNNTVDEFDGENISNLIGQYQSNSKKKKLEVNIEACQESRQKILDVMTHQQDARKDRSDLLLRDLSEVMLQLEADCTAMKDNEKKIEHLTGAVVKCMQQATTAHKQKLKTLKDIYSSFQKQVEGLLTKGAIKPDDRPLWFDVYKAFPPTSEPKYAKPKPDIKPIRQILYPEDAVRVKFHSQGYGLASINILSETEPQIKKLVQQYNKFKSEGVAAQELIEKSVESVASERQFEAAKVKIEPKATEKQATEVDLKNIFKD